jgi:hypothetical protein
MLQEQKADNTHSHSCFTFSIHFYFSIHIILIFYYHIIVVLEVHCDIYKSSYNIS